MKIRPLAFAVGVVSAALGATLAIAPPASAAPSATVGLYGAQDPTYDGVFRQSAALAGLAVNGVTPARAAVQWLLAQQCADGSFQEYRSDLIKPCDPVDPATGTGPDTNATAAALIALMTLDDTPTVQDSPNVRGIVDAADRAGVWLSKQQRADGGFPFFPGSDSDANSTGLALNALMLQAPNVDVPVYRKAKAFLARIAAPCSTGGGLPYQAGGKVDALSTSQAVAGLVVAFGSDRREQPKGAPRCTAEVTRNGLTYLSSALMATGMLPSSLGTGDDSNATATAVVDLSRARTGRAAVVKATAALQANAAAFTSGASSTTARGILLQVARITGSNPRSFGGVNLVSTLTASMRRA